MHARKDSGCDLYPSEDIVWAGVQQLWKAQKQLLDEFQYLEETKLPALFSEENIDRFVNYLQSQKEAQCTSTSANPSFRLLKAQLRTLMSARLPKDMTKAGYGLPHTLPDYAQVNQSNGILEISRILNRISQLGERCRFATVDAHLSAYVPSGCGLSGMTLRSLVEREENIRLTMAQLTRSHQEWMASLTLFRNAATVFLKTATGSGLEDDDEFMQLKSDPHLPCHTLPNLTEISSVFYSEDDLDAGEVAIRERVLESLNSMDLATITAPAEPLSRYAYWSKDDNFSSRSSSLLSSPPDSSRSLTSYAIESTDYSIYSR
jgi:hypothetical protein